MGRFCFSVSSCVELVMCPDNASGCCNVIAQLSRIKLCGIFLLCFLHLKVWSPHLSCCFPHGHCGRWEFVNRGSLSFLFIAIRKLQLGSRFAVLLRFMLMSGYDVCGTRMLGNRCRCSLAVL